MMSSLFVCTWQRANVDFAAGFFFFFFPLPEIHLCSDQSLDWKERAVDLGWQLRKININKAKHKKPKTQLEGKSFIPTCLSFAMGSRVERFFFSLFMRDVKLSTHPHLQ